MPASSRNPCDRQERRANATAEGSKMVQLMIEMPEEALAALRKAAQEFARELRLAAAVKWYELKMLSQERAAGIAGISRSEFIDALGRFGVTPFQYSANE